MAVAEAVARPALAVTSDCTARCDHQARRFGTARVDVLLRSGHRRAKGFTVAPEHVRHFEPQLAHWAGAQKGFGGVGSGSAGTGRGPVTVRLKFDVGIGSRRAAPRLYASEDNRVGGRSRRL
jgi:hypothetical protein